MEISLREVCEEHKEELLQFRENFNKEKLEVRKTPCEHDTNVIKNLLDKNVAEELRKKISKRVFSCLYCYHKYHDLVIEKIDNDMNE